MLAITPTALPPRESSAQNGDGNLAIPTHEQRETAQYVADMILELRNLSKALKLYAVTVPLEYAYYEAFSVANRTAAPAAEVERLRDLSRLAEHDQHG